ncbi:MAG: hypothetical protein NT070_01060 [Cyanobacteria bacterium]|nr:hypothetical protein [Cyanobacteriota bacterium]
MSPNLDDLSRQLDSPDVKDRKLALAALREVSAHDAFPLDLLRKYHEIVCSKDKLSS